MGWIDKTFLWFRQLFEEDGEPSLRRVAFGYSLLLVTFVLVWHCYSPSTIDEHVVLVFNKIFLYVATIWGVRGLVDSALEKLMK